MRNGSRGVAMLLLMAAGLIPASARAQSDENHSLARGRRSISFDLPAGGGSSFGYWIMTSDRTNLGILADINWRSLVNDPGSTSSQEQSGWRVGLSPAMKHYVEELGPVLPFLYGSIGAGVGRSNSNQPGVPTLKGWDLGASVGVGAEWFPVRSVSIGGHTGARIVHYRTNREGGVSGESTAREWLASTVTSSLAIQIYFGGRKTETPTAAGQN